MSSWVLTTGCDDAYAAIRDITFPNLANYAYFHDIDYVPHNWTGETGIQLSWQRVENTLELLEEGYKYVFFVDSDAVILREGAWIGDVVGKHYAHPDRSIWLAYQTLGGECFPSCGVWVVKNDEWGRRWCKTILDNRDDYAGDPWCEQGVAYDLLGFDSSYKAPSEAGRPYQIVTEWTDHVGYLPRRWHSTPQDPVFDPILFHATGGVSKGVEARRKELLLALNAPSVV